MLSEFVYSIVAVLFACGTIMFLPSLNCEDPEEAWSYILPAQRVLRVAILILILQSIIDFFTA